MFGLSNLRLGIYAAAALFVAVLVWSNHRLTGRLATAKAATAQATANLATERAAIAHERKINSEALNEREDRLKALAAARADTPTRIVRCRTAERVPATPAAATGTDARVTGELQAQDGSHPPNWRGAGDGWTGKGDYDPWSEDAPDAGPAIDSLMDEADNGFATCAALQKWAGSL